MIRRHLWIAWPVLAALFVLFIVMALISDAQHVQEHSDKAVIECRRMGGEAILTYSLSTNTFFLTGCRLK